MTGKTNKQAVRPAKNIIKPIKDRPEHGAQAIMKGEPKKNWKYKKSI